MNVGPPNGFHLKTPLIRSDPLSKIAGRDVYLKLDNLQPSGSFKIRGIGRTCQIAVANGATRLVGSSGGNAGLAMAHAAQGLGVPLSLFVPTSSPKVILDKAKTYDIDLHIVGENWDAANAEAEKLLDQEAGAVFIHPFEKETTWSGHSTIVEEIHDQLAADFGIRSPPAGIITCVGGGGLATGIILGLQKVCWTETPLICVETDGADCFDQSMKQGKLVKLSGIRTIAKSLGALAVTKKLLHLATEEHRVLTRVVSDQQALQACLEFSRDHRMLVEPACGAALSAVYSRLDLDLKEDLPLVMVVCGGNMATFELFDQWKTQLGIK